MMLLIEERGPDQDGCRMRIWENEQGIHVNEIIDVNGEVEKALVDN